MQCLRVAGAAQLYAGAMSPPAAEQIISALKLIQDADGSGRGPRKLTQLRENSNYFREKLQEIGLNVLGDRDSPVMVRARPECALQALHAAVVCKTVLSYLPSALLHHHVVLPEPTSFNLRRASFAAATHELVFVAVFRSKRSTCLYRPVPLPWHGLCLTAQSSSIGAV